MMQHTDKPPRRARTAARPTARAFTLVELLVVIAIIALVAALTIPTINTLFESGSDTQAYQMLDAMVRAARAYAMEHRTYAGVHVQPFDADVRTKDATVCFGCVVGWNPETERFGRATGFEPIQFPGNMAFGHIQKENNTMNADGSFRGGDPGMFLNLTIVFDPDGKLVRTVGSSRIRFEESDPLFRGDTAIWDHETAQGGSSNWSGGEVGAEVVTMFNLQEFNNLGGGGQRGAFLNENGIFIGINHFTGQLFPRE
jgi:prepilin-type N-terminal cleavage/methylation domain-containing protein